MLGAWSWHEKRNRDVRGSPTVEFVATQKPKKRPRKELREEPWPLYGYDVARTRAAPFKLRPPYGGLWSIRTRGALEGPPVVAYGRVFFIDSHGDMYAVRARTGRIEWRRKFPNCAAASPAVADGVVYVPLMHRAPCAEEPAECGRLHRGSRREDRHDPLEVYSRSGRVRATDRRAHPLLRLLGQTRLCGRPSREAPSHALELRDGRQSGRGTCICERNHLRRDERRPCLRAERAHGKAAVARRIVLALRQPRVLLRHADGRVRARLHRQRRRHRLRLRREQRAICSGRGRSGPTSTRPRPSGGRPSSSAPGTATSSRSTLRTGNVRWRFDAPASITGAPTVLAGLVYFSTCGRCGAGGLRRVKNGPRGTWALNARNGEPVWHFPDGKYSALVADGRRIYISGRNKVYALIPQLRWEKLQRLKAKEKCAHLKRARARARCLSKARRGTSSGTHGSKRAGRTSKRKNR